MTTLRLRLVFAALALALAFPGALLVRRALESVALERESRERAVAERVFDEMERALSELLGAEEARPASDYDFASAASPLHARTDGALALGWFQIEADGRVTAPAWAERAAALAREVALEGARLEAAARKRKPAVGRRDRQVRTEQRTLEDAPLRESAAQAPAPATAAAPRELATQTPPRVEQAQNAAADAVAPSAAAEPAPAEEADAYAALSKLNTGAKEREERKQRVYVEEQATQSPAPEAQAADARPEPSAAPTASGRRFATDARLRSEAIVAEAMAAEARQGEWSDLAAERGALGAGRADTAAAATDADKDGSRDDGVAAPAGDPAVAAAEAPDAPAGVVAKKAEAEPAAAPAPRAPEPLAAAAPPFAASGELRAAPEANAAPREDAELVRVVVDPLRGRLARSGELLLVRSAWVGARGVRQGVVFELAALERLLVANVLAQAELESGDLRLAPALSLAAGAPSSERRAFAHRFGEPFEAVAAELSFAPFADDGARSVYWLAGLFTLAGAGGLYAAYRSTAVALHFAERRSNFAAAVSHELKTPLTAIRLYAEMLRDGLVAGDEKRREYYRSITAETERLSRLINNVLEFSRLERGARSLELRAGDVAPVVREAVELLRPHAAEHGLALELSVEDGLPPVRFERDALLQIVFNLVDNAVKYGRGDLARIEVSCRRAGDGVAVVVRDHGPGVPREDLARILEPFYRRGDESTRTAPGAGIGLALVRSLAEEMRAALAVSNAEQGGLEVSLTLPGSPAGA